MILRSLMLSLRAVYITFVMLMNTFKTKNLSPNINKFKYRKLIEVY